MKCSRISAWLEHQWYGSGSSVRLLVPLSGLYSLIVRLRRKLYALGFFRVGGPDCPVIVVGNLTVGGTGKTPLVVWLAQYLSEQGWHPGIVSRGYGGRAASWPQRVFPQSDPQMVGDEAVLISRRTQCPVAVAPNRVQAAQVLCHDERCDVIISDDGLQHYALRRDIEIVVVDATRRFGNGLSLPAGPLRESPSRLSKVDLVVYNGAIEDQTHIAMQLIGDQAVNNHDPKRTRLLSEFSAQRCHAVAAIGNPSRFFDHLSAHGLEFDAHPFPDHHRFDVDDLNFADNAPVLMTEKDAVKCFRLSRSNHWHVPVKARVKGDLEQKILNLLRG